MPQNPPRFNEPPLADAPGVGSASPQKEAPFNIRRIFGFLHDATTDTLVACLQILGHKTPNLDPFDKVSNPDGWKGSSVVTYSFLEARMEEYARELRQSRAATERVERLLYNLWLRECGESLDEVEIAPPETSSELS